MKKLLIGLLIACVGLVESKAATTTIAVAGNSFTNYPQTPNGPYVVKQFIFANSNNAEGTIAIYDLSTNVLLSTNAAYTNTLTTLSNNVVTHTNYYGYTNYTTNIGIYDNTNNVVAAVTNTATPTYTVLCPSNSTTVTGQVQVRFNNGLQISNNCASNINVTLTWQ